MLCTWCVLVQCVSAATPYSKLTVYVCDRLALVYVRYDVLAARVMYLGRPSRNIFSKYCTTRMLTQTLQFL